MSSPGAPEPSRASASTLALKRDVSKYSKGWRAFNTFFAGSVAGFAAELAVHPVDVVNLRMKLDKTSMAYNKGVKASMQLIFRQEGIRGLYAGITTTALGALPVSGLYFGSYELWKHLGNKHLVRREKHPVPAPVVHFVAGALAELSCTVLQVPMEIVRSRQQLQGCPHLGHMYPYLYCNPVHGIRSIVADEGLVGLYAGIRPSVMMDCSQAALQFMFYERFKLIGHHMLGYPLSPWHNVVTGGLAGAVAGVITNPLDVVTSRLQTQGTNRTYDGMIHCMKTIYREEGAMAFAKGMRARVVWLLPQSGIAFGIFELMKRVLELDADAEL